MGYVAWSFFKNGLEFSSLMSLFAYIPVLHIRFLIIQARGGAIFMRLFACMCIFYLANLVKAVVNSYELIDGNGRHVFGQLLDTVLFSNALVNAVLVLYHFEDTFRAVLTYLRCQCTLSV